MTLFQRLKSWLEFISQRDQMDRGMDAEMSFHIDQYAEDLMRKGVPAEEARRRARIEFGGIERAKEECREARGGQFLEVLMQDVRVSLRVLRKSPGFAAVAIATLALAIGANAVVFSVLNALILRPLNVANPDSFYGVWRVNESAQLSYPDYIELRDRNHSFEALAAYNVNRVGVTYGENASLAWIEEASGNYFDALGIQPYLGRVFHRSDEHGWNSAPYVVLSYDYWHTHLRDDRGVVGRVIQLNKQPFTVLGVTPPGFNGTLIFFHPDFFVPLVDAEQLDGVNNLEDRKAQSAVFMSMGHLKPGVTPTQASADLTAIGSYLQKSYPQYETHMAFTLARPGLYGDYLGKPLRAFMSGLMLLAGLILLAACANLGSLFAARAADRSREVALRLALGSSRIRILRQVFTEAVLVSLTGGAVGLWGSILLLRGLSTWQPFARWPVYLPVNPDAKVYLLALFLAVASGFLFGAVPVRQILQTNPYEVVKLGVHGRGGRHLSARDLLLVSQIAICAVLVTASIVAVRGLMRSLHSNFGFEPRNIVLVDTDLITGGYTKEQVPAMQKRMLEAVQSIAGVESAALIDRTPLNGDAKGTLTFKDSSTDLRPANSVAEVYTFSTSPEYLDTARTALLSGRKFTWHDDLNAPRVAIVNAMFAQKLFGAVDHAIGSYFKLRDGTRVQVVGIVEGGKYESLTEDLQPALFFPILQSPSSQNYLVVRSSREPQQLTAALKKTLRGLDAGLPLSIETWEQELQTALFGARMATAALGVLGTMGAILSITGIFGMAAYSVSRRLRELGIRIALGARSSEVLQSALGRAFKLLAIGSAAGLVLGILASRVLAYIVLQATPRDPLVLTAAVLAMALLGLLATWIPAHRALSVSPLMLLRDE